MDTLLAADGIGAHLAYLALVALISGMARGFAGFGAAMIFVPLASAVIGPRTAVPILFLMDAVMALPLIPSAFRLGDRREVLTMSLGAMVGVPLGIAVLTGLDPIAFRWAIVVVVFSLLALLVSGWRYRGRPKPALTVGVGVVAGLFSGAAQVGGPPVVAYWLGGVIPARIVRANIIFYFAVATALSAVGYVWSGLITGTVMLPAAVIAPAYGLGLFLGSRVFGLADEAVFRRICFSMIAVATLLSMPLLDGVLR